MRRFFKINFINSITGMKKIAVIPVLFMIISGILNAQGPAHDKSFYYSYGSPVFIEAHAMPSEYPDSVKIMVFMKVMNDVLAFKPMRTARADEERFWAEFLVDVEFKDSIGIVRKRDAWKDTVIVNDFAKTNSKKDYHYGYVVENVPAGSVTVIAELLSHKGMQMKSERIELKDNNDFLNSREISKPLFAYGSEGTYHPFVLDNNVSFTSKDSKVFMNFSFKKDPGTFYYRIKKVEPKKDVVGWNDSIYFDGVADITENAYFEVSPNSHNDLITLQMKKDYNYSDAGDHGFKIGIMELDLHAEKLVPGDYRLDIFESGKQDTMKYLFKVIWEDIPLSLKNSVDYAIESTYYIMKQEDYDRINEGSDREKFQKLLQFWGDRDPTPNTPFNEKMAQYYKRVDYAYFNYKTISEKDGAKTDRGKIYILHGEPDKVEVKLENNKTREIWWYDNLKKEFIFEQVKTGVYKLININEI